MISLFRLGCGKRYSYITICFIFEMYRGKAAIESFVIILSDIK